MLLFNVQWEIFNKQVAQVAAYSHYVVLSTLTYRG